MSAGCAREHKPAPDSGRAAPLGAFCRCSSRYSSAHRSRNRSTPVAILLSALPRARERAPGSLPRPGLQDRGSVHLVPGGCETTSPGAAAARSVEALSSLSRSNLFPCLHLGAAILPRALPLRQTIRQSAFLETATGSRPPSIAFEA